MKTVFQGIGVFILAVVVFGFVGFIADGANFFSYKFWAPKQENVRRQVFINTDSYIQGKTTYLSRLRFQYENATGDQKSALKQLILDEASTVDNEKLPVGLQVFISQLGGN